MKFPRPSTLHIVFPCGQTLALAVIIMLLIVSGLEMIFRLPSVESRLAVPSIGSRNDEFEIQVYRLHQFAEAGPVDCFFLGSSIVLRGIQPSTFAEAYRQQTGQTLRCYTFGLSGLTASAAGLLADYLVHTYHPRLLICGLSPRDFNEAIVVQGFSAHELAALDWMKYERGAFDVTGWLFAHLYSFQYAYFYRNALTRGFEGKIEHRNTTQSRIDPDGYHPVKRVLSWPISRAEKERIARLYQAYIPLPAELDGLQHITRLHDSGRMQVVLVEVPFHPDVLTQFLGMDNYRVFTQQMESYAASGDVPYWPTVLLDLIPADGWMDLNHLNSTGAAIFSEWLGNKVGAAVVTGDLVLPGS